MSGSPGRGGRGVKEKRMAAKAEAEEGEKVVEGLSRPNL